MTEFELTISILAAVTVGVWTGLLYGIWSVLRYHLGMVVYWLEMIAGRS